MISVFPPTTTLFTGTGIAVLDADIVEAVVSEELNGEFVLHLTYPSSAPAAQHLTVGNIVACSVPGRDTPQGFRIHTTTTTLDGLIQIVALHMSYDLAASVIADTYVVNKDANAALAHILGAANPRHAFTSRSNVDVTASARIVRKSVLESVFGSDDNAFLSRWGGEILRDNHHLTHLERLGADRGVVIRDRKNLTGYTSTIDTTTLTTRILPVGFDGLTLPELYVDSPRIHDYERPMVRVMHFDHVKASKEGQTPAEDELPLPQAFEALREACRQTFTEGADVPVSSYEVSFVDLATTVEYADFAPLEQVMLGDTVHVIHDDLAVRLTVRVTGYSYNPLLGAYVSVRLGNAKETLTARTHTIVSQISALTNETAKASADAAVALVAADGKTSNHYGEVQPSAARVGDTWFKPNGTTTEIWIYTRTGTGFEWVPVATDINHSVIAADLEAARMEVAAAQINSQEALQAATRISQSLSDAQPLIAQAKKSAAQALSEAREVSGVAEQIRARAEQVAGEISEVNSVLVSVRANAQAAVTAAGKVRNDLAEQAKLVTAAKAQADATKMAHDALRLEFTNYTNGNAQALIALRDSVLLRATKADVIAQINVSPESVLIDGKRIHITGTTTIDDASIHGAKIIDATIASAKIASLDAGKITTGTLSADRIGADSITGEKLSIRDGFITRAMIRDAAINSAKIAGLAAEKITSGYLAAARIQAGSITSDKLTVANGFITNAMIHDATITAAKIASIDAGKITTGTLAATRIAAGSITSDKLTIANGFITTAMIKDAAITNAKIASLDAGKITAGYLSASRIKAKSITADKLAANAIQVGLAGWTSNIRITPTTLSWYSGSTLEGQIGAGGMEFYYGSRYIGHMGQGYKENDTNVRGIAIQLNGEGDYVTWAYRSGNTGTYTTMFTLDPKGKFNTGQPGIHLGAGLYTHANSFYTEGKRTISLADCTLTGLGTYPGWASANGKAKLVFQTDDLIIVTRNYFYNLTYAMSRLKDLMTRMNTLIGLLNRGWITSITDKGGGNITWNYYNGTGLTTMSTQLG